MGGDGLGKDGQGRVVPLMPVGHVKSLSQGPTVFMESMEEPHVRARKHGETTGQRGRVCASRNARLPGASSHLATQRGMKHVSTASVSLLTSEPSCSSMESSTSTIFASDDALHEDLGITSAPQDMRSLLLQYSRDALCRFRLEGEASLLALHMAIRGKQEAVVRQLLQ